MKTSNKILSITGIVIAVIILLLVLGSRIFLSSYAESMRYTMHEIKTICVKDIGQDEYLILITPSAQKLVASSTLNFS